MPGALGSPRRGIYVACIVLLIIVFIAKQRSSASKPTRRETANDDAGTTLARQNAAARDGSGGQAAVANEMYPAGRRTGRVSGYDTDDVDFDEGQYGSRSGRWSWDWLQNNAAQRVKQGLDWAGAMRANSGTGSTDPNDLAGSGRQPNQAGPHEDALSYHRHLEQEHAPHSYSQHSRTLTFSNIYVLSLSKRSDRRLRMGKIAKALGLTFTFVDATDKEVPMIGWIAERVKEIRDRKRTILATALDKPEDQIGGLSINSIWLKGNDRARGIKLPDMRKVDDRWTLPLDSLSAADKTAAVDGNFARDGTAIVNWVTYLDGVKDLGSLKASGATPAEPVNVTELLFDPVEDVPGRQVNEGVVATYYSQTHVWKKMIEAGDKSALILEDDIDIEFDVERSWPNVQRALPPEWDVVFLGHCWGKELTRAQYVHPSLRSSSEPRCLHGYALSAKGARRLLDLSSDPWRAYQTPIDTLIPYFTRQAPDPSKRRKNKPQISTGHLVAFSMEPSIIIQSKELDSDIQAGIGSTWRGVLADSTWDRILRDEGKPVKQLTFTDTRSDPAIKARPWTDAKAANSGKGPAHIANEGISPPIPPDSNPVPDDEPEARRLIDLGLVETADGDGDVLTEEEQEVEAARQAAREKAMARIIDNGSFDKQPLQLPKKPANMVGAKGKNKKPNPIGNGDEQDESLEDHVREEMAAVADSLKKGEKGPKKGGDGKRVGTGPKRIGPIGGAVDGGPAR